jgi:uncharacterized protein (DUF362 family)
MPTSVVIAKTPINPTVKELKQILAENLASIGRLENIIQKNSRVLLKPNAGVAAGVETGRNTDPRLLEALILVLKELNPREIIIGESAIIGTDTMEAYKASGILDVAYRTGVKILDLKKGKFTKHKVKDYLVLDTIEVSQIINEIDILINLPKLKTIPSVPVSIGLKNLKGLLPDTEKKRFHYTCLKKAIVDLNKVVKTDLVIVDGIIACEMYEPKEMNTLVLGYDVLAVDTTACLIMGIDPYEVEYLNLANEAHIGTNKKDEIILKGANIEEVKKSFVRAPSSSEAFAHLYPEVNIVDGDACSGCAAALYMGLKRLKDDNLLTKLNGFNIAMGKKISSEIKSPVLYIGNCACKIKGEKNLPGCPFTSMDLYDTLKNFAG